MKHTIFFGGIPKTVPEKKILAYFIQFGDIEKLILDPIDPKSKQSSSRKNEKNLHRGCGYITFSDNESYEEVLNKDEHILNGAEIDCKKALTKEEKYKNDLRVVKQRRKIFLPKLPKNIKKSRIKTYFKNFGDIEEVSIIKSKNKNASFGFVTFKENFKGLEVVNIPIFLSRRKISIAEFSDKGLKLKEKLNLKKDQEEFLAKFKLKLGDYFIEEITKGNHKSINLKFNKINSAQKEAFQLKFEKLIKSLECTIQYRF